MLIAAFSFKPVLTTSVGCADDDDHASLASAIVHRLHAGRAARRVLVALARRRARHRSQRRELRGRHDPVTVAANVARASEALGGLARVSFQMSPASGHRAALKCSIERLGTAAAPRIRFGGRLSSSHAEA
jgi:hypothetical protein